jgi:UDP-N-acetylmuramoylalanine--D-glutamate ligase
MELNQQRVLVVGMGRTGLACALFAASRGAHVTCTDAQGPDTLRVQLDELHALGGKFVQGEPTEELACQMDVIIVSPGVPALSALQHAEQRGVPVVSEIEFASWYYQGSYVCITGTNGKSTVTTLVGEMVRSLGVPVFVGGNLGTPWVEAIGTEADCAEGLAILEVSSFQLERVRRLKPKVACLLNVTADHLDRHGTLAQYAAAKGQMFRSQTKSDYAVVPWGDPLITPMARASAASLKTFGGASGDVRVQGGYVVSERTGWRFAVADLAVTGEHNVLNACAAVLVAELLGVSPTAIEDVLRTFRGLPHRMQRVAVVDGVTFYDDSKATNVGAAVAAIEGLDKSMGRVILLAGGVDKGGSYAPLARALQARDGVAVLFGEAASLIESALADTPSVQVMRAGSMREAVQLAFGAARPGDVVLLAPACSSFDMFRSYAHRGDAFQRELQELQERQTQQKSLERNGLGASPESEVSR